MGICIHGEPLAGGPAPPHSSSECLTRGDLFVGLQGLFFLVLLKSYVSTEGFCGQPVGFMLLQFIGLASVGILL